MVGTLPETMTIRLGLDLLMTLLFVASLAFRITGDAPHEWIGMALCVLFVTHCIINRRWFRNLFNGRYGMRRILNTSVNLGLLAAMLILCVCGIANSDHVFGFLHFTGGMEFRQIHSLMAYWGWVLIGVHAGMHWPVVINAARKLAGIRGENKPRKAVLRLLAASFAGFGVWASFDRDMGSKLFLGYSFDFWDPGRPVILFFASNLAILGTYTCLSHLAFKFRRKPLAVIDPGKK